MTKKMLPLAIVLLTVACVTAQTIATSTSSAAQQSAATQKASPTPEPESVDDVVRITAKLVQLDLVVTDKTGKQVTDLKPEDFEIFEDGRAQPITHFSYIFTGPTSGPTATDATAGTAAGTPPPAPLRREKVKRTIAVVIDDLGMSFETTVSARAALKKFVNEQIQPGDLVAILRTGGAIGVLQQFTADRRQLLAAVEQVRWNRCGRGGIRVLSSVGNAYEPLICGADSVRASVEGIRSIISGMRDLPGRKSVILFADGFPIDKEKNLLMPDLANVSYPQSGIADKSFALPKIAGQPMYFDAVSLLTETAIRASVVVYAVDTRGLQVLSVTSADQVGGYSGQAQGRLLEQRSRENLEGRPESAELAEKTGGFMVQNTNDLNLGLNRIMQDQQGYYLIGYRPGGETFDRRFHKITARVRTRSDLNVRTRSGFYGMTDETSRPAKPTAVDRFQLALASPFAAGEIDVRLTPAFTSLPDVGPVLRSMLHINARDLTFKEEPGGWRSAELVLRSLLLGEQGRIVDEHRRAFTVRLRGATFERVQSQGFDYVFNMPAKKPGAYQFRIALLDTISSRVGSAGQYVEVPDLKKNRLALSGIVLNAAGPGATAAAEPAPSSLDATEGALKPQPAGANAAARRFQRNTSLNYDYMVFNASGGSAGGQLTTLVRLFRDGKLVFEHSSPAEIMQQPDPTRVLVGGRMRLGTNLLPGEYVIQITVTDPSAKKGQGTATESADFEIVD